jgi:hypothetical protein
MMGESGVTIEPKKALSFRRSPVNENHPSERVSILNECYKKTYKRPGSLLWLLLTYWESGNYEMVE